MWFYMDFEYRQGALETEARRKETWLDRLVIECKLESWASLWESVWFMPLSQAAAPNKIRLILKIQTFLINPLKPVKARCIYSSQKTGKLVTGDLEKNLYILWFHKCFLDHKSKTTILYWLGCHSYASELQNPQPRACGGWWCRTAGMGWSCLLGGKLWLRIIPKQQVGDSHPAV